MEDASERLRRYGVERTIEGKPTVLIDVGAISYFPELNGSQDLYQRFLQDVGRQIAVINVTDNPKPTDGSVTVYSPKEFNIRSLSKIFPELGDRLLLESDLRRKLEGTK